MSENIDAIKKSQKLLIIIILLILIMGGYGGWALYKLLKNEGGTSTTAPVAPSVPVYMALDTFTVNVINPDNDPERVLYVGLTLRLPDQATHSELSNNLPEVRSRLLRLFSRQQAAALSTEEGKQKLASEIKVELTKPYGQNRPNLAISDVLFTAFILR